MISEGDKQKMLWLAEMLTAKANGKVLEFYTNAGGWEPYNGLPSMDSIKDSWRIAPEKNVMNLRPYTCTQFEGHHPVGQAAVIMALDEDNAADLLEAQLASIGLPQEIDRNYIQPVHTTLPHALILCDGNY